MLEQVRKKHEHLWAHIVDSIVDGTIRSSSDLVELKKLIYASDINFKGNNCYLCDHFGKTMPGTTVMDCGDCTMKIFNDGDEVMKFLLKDAQYYAMDMVTAFNSECDIYEAVKDSLEDGCYESAEVLATLIRDVFKLKDKVDEEEN